MSLNPSIKTALFVGRFQPLHLGHLDGLKQILDQCDRVIIAIGSVNVSGSKDNPLSFPEREILWRAVLAEEVIDEKVVGIFSLPDFGDDRQWLEYIEKNLPKYDVSFSGSELTRASFSFGGEDCRQIVLRLPINATLVRAQIMLWNESWRNFVPKAVEKKMEEWKIGERLEKITLENMNFNIFRAYDIRGIADESLGSKVEFFPEDAYLIGKAVGTYLHDRYSVDNMAVGRDVRLTSGVLQKAYMKGVAETGIKVTDIGLAVSPMVYWASCALDFDAATNITASHNPKDYNGIKIVSKNAHSICGEEFEDIIKIIKSGRFKTVENPPKIEELDIRERYLQDLEKRLPMGAKKLKVVTDTGNGVAGPFAPELLRRLGCEVVELYSEPDGNFPNHPSNPEEEENMRDLMAKVLEVGADVGIGFDGDGDRVGIVDEKGKMWHADFILLMLARDVATRVKDPQIVFDVKVSQAIISELEKIPAKPIMHKTGHSFIEQKMKELNAPLAGEISGHMFFGEDYFEFDDSLLASGKIVQILSKSGETISQMFEKVPKTYNTPEFKISCPDAKKFAIVEKIVEHFVEKYNCLTIDGVRIRFDENTWAGIRASNTSPKLTVRFEADSPEKLLEIQKLVADKLAEFPEVDNAWFKG